MLKENLTPSEFINQILTLLQNLIKSINQRNSNNKENDNKFVTKMHQSLESLSHKLFPKIGIILQWVTKSQQSIIMLSYSYDKDITIKLSKLVLSKLSLLQININWLLKNDMGGSVIYDITSNGDVDLLEFIDKKSDINLFSSIYYNGETLLNCAAIHNQIHMAKWILDNIQDQKLLEYLILTGDRVGYNPLHSASLRGFTKMLKIIRAKNEELFVQALCTPNAKNWTPVELAIFENKADTVGYLLWYYRRGSLHDVLKLIVRRKAWDTWNMVMNTIPIAKTRIPLCKFHAEIINNLSDFRFEIIYDVFHYAAGSGHLKGNNILGSKACEVIKNQISTIRVLDNEFAQMLLPKHVSNIIYDYIYRTSLIKEQIIKEAYLITKTHTYGYDEALKYLKIPLSCDSKSLLLEEQQVTDIHFSYGYLYNVGVFELVSQFLLIEVRMHERMCKFLTNYEIDEQQCLSTQPWIHGLVIVAYCSYTHGDFTGSVQLAQFYSYGVISKTISYYSYYNPNLIIFPLCMSALYMPSMKFPCLYYSAINTFGEDILEYYGIEQNNGIGACIMQSTIFGIAFYALHQQNDGDLSMASLMQPGATARTALAVLMCDIVGVLYRAISYYLKDVDVNVQEEHKYRLETCDQGYCQVKQEKFNDLLIVNLIKLISNNELPILDDITSKIDILLQPDNNVFCLQFCSDNIGENKGILSAMINISLQQIDSIYCNKQSLFDQYYYDEI